MRAVVRLIPGVLGDEESAKNDSFSQEGLLEGPQYTRPEVLEGGAAVPAALLSGDHARIRRYRRKAALQRTLARRPELLRSRRLDAEERSLLREIFVAGGTDPGADGSDA